MHRKLAPILIDSADRVGEVRERACREQCDELLGCAEVLPLVLTESHLRLPVSATFPDPPDIVLASDQSKLAIEVTRITWERLTQVSAEAAKKWPASLIELDPELLVDKPARRKKGASKGTPSGDYGWIRQPGEKLKSAGMLGDCPLSKTIAALHAAIAKKTLRLSQYSASSPSVWLFLIHDGYPGAWSEIINHTDYRREVMDGCKRSGFERVYLYRFEQSNLTRLH